MPLEEPIRPEVKEEITALSHMVSLFVDMTFGKDKMGFVVLLFDLGQSGFMSYSSNARREDMVKAMRELLINFESDIRKRN